jgi:hypothetical protein
MSHKPDLLRQMDIDEAKKVTGRGCGSCSLCCRLMDVPSAGKQTAEWYPHCRPSRGGCSIYPERLQVCRNWACGWLTDPNLDDQWFPQRCGIVVDMPRMEDGSIIARFHVDPRTPDKWRQDPFHSRIRQVALRGLRGDAGVQFATVISIAKRPWLLVLPHAETGWGPGVTLMTGPDRWEFLRFNNAEAAVEFGAKLHAMEEILVETQQYPGLAPMALLDHTAPRLCELFSRP